MTSRWYGTTAGACLVAALLSGACSKTDAPSAPLAGTTTGAGMAIEVRAESDPPRSGDNTFDVTVTKDGAPVADATVTVEFSMPAMPSMNMPEMRSAASLAPQGDGRYRGTGRLDMAGTWNVMVKVSRGGEEMGSQRLNIVAK